MYIVLLSYTAPVEEVDYVLPDHVAWLARQYAAGHFLMSGRQPTRNGDVIIARSMTRGKLEALLATDPFDTNRLVHHEIVEFRATGTAPGLSQINEALLG
jgi:uncharacterized protein YciI